MPHSEAAASQPAAAQVGAAVPWCGGEEEREIKRKSRSGHGVAVTVMVTLTGGSSVVPGAAESGSARDGGAQVPPGGCWVSRAGGSALSSPRGAVPAAVLGAEGSPCAGAASAPAAVLGADESPCAGTASSSPPAAASASSAVPTGSWAPGPALRTHAGSRWCPGTGAARQRDLGTHVRNSRSCSPAETDGCEVWVSGDELWPPMSPPGPGTHAGGSPGGGRCSARPEAMLRWPPASLPPPPPSPPGRPRREARLEESRGNMAGSGDGQSAERPGKVRACA